MRWLILLLTVLSFAPASAVEPDRVPYLLEMIKSSANNVAACAAKLDEVTKELAEAKSAEAKATAKPKEPAHAK